MNLVSFHKLSIWIYSLFLLFTACNLYIQITGYQEIIIDAYVEKGSLGQIFWANTISDSYDEVKSVKFNVTPGKESKYRLTIPSREIAKIRFDLTNKKGLIKINQIKIVRNPYFIQFSKNSLIKILPLQNIESINLKSDKLLIIPSNDDPILEIKSRYLNFFHTPFSVYILVFTILIFPFVFKFNELKKLNLDKFQKSNHFANSFFEYLNFNFSESHLIIFNLKVVYTLTILLLISISFILAEINFSSIDYWYTLSPLVQPHGLLLGQPRGIRSDEWLFWTTDLFSQIHSKVPFQIHNFSIGNGNAPLLMNLPAYHFSMLFRPQFWAFFFLNQETAFSIYWIFKTFFLFGSSLLLFLIILDNSFLLSFTGAFWLFFSSFTQWWIGGAINDVLVIWNILAISSIYLLFSKKLLNILISGCICLIMGINFVLIFYPPYQIPLTYLLISILVGCIFRETSKNNFKYLKLKSVIVITIILISTLTFYFFYLDTAETINSVRSTVYPGQRRVSGGSLSLLRYFSGFFDLYYKEAIFPKAIGNICEGSSFIFLWIFTIVNFSFFCKKGSDKMYLSLLAAILFLSVYAVVGFPSYLEKITLLNFVQPERTIMALGIAGILLTLISLKFKSKILLKNSVQKASFCTSIFLIFFCYGVKFNNTIDHFFSYVVLGFFAIAYTIIIYFFIQKRVNYFCISIILITLIPNLNINPVTKGLDSLVNNSLVEFINTIPNRYDGKWALFGDMIYANLLKVTGVEVLNGVKYSPDIVSFSKLDPENKYFSVYNRYAHIELVSDNKYQLPQFDLIQADYYKLYINPCSEHFKNLNVKFVVLDNISAKNLDCLNPLSLEPILEKIMVYELKER